MPMHRKQVEECNVKQFYKSSKHTHFLITMTSINPSHLLDNKICLFVDVITRILNTNHKTLTLKHFVVLRRTSCRRVITSSPLFSEDTTRFLAQLKNAAINQNLYALAYRQLTAR